MCDSLTHANGKIYTTSIVIVASVGVPAAVVDVRLTVTVYASNKEMPVMVTTRQESLLTFHFCLK